MRISDIATVKRGSSPRPIINYISNKGYPWLKISDFTYGERYVFSTKEYIIEEGLKNTRYVPKGTLIVTNSASPGIPIFLGKDMCLHDGFLYFENLSNQVVPMYLYYFILSNRDYLVSQGNGSVFTNLKKEILENMPIELPEISHQQHIVDILGSIDAKIENNQEKVDLLLKNLRLQFIVRFTKQELTKSTALSYFITETIGGDWGKGTAQGNYSERVVCLRGADIPEIASGKNGDPPTRYILPKNLLTKQLAPWEIIVEISGGSPTQSTGRCALITSEMLSNYSTPIICTNFCRAIRCKNPQFAAYVYSLLIAMYNNNLFFNYENGTTGIKNLDLSSILEKEYVYLPSEDELESFYRFTSKTYKQIEQHKTENNKLNELKQLYLKKFFG